VKSILKWIWISLKMVGKLVYLFLIGVLAQSLVLLVFKLLPDIPLPLALTIFPFWSIALGLIVVGYAKYEDQFMKEWNL